MARSPVAWCRALVGASSLAAVLLSAPAAHADPKKKVDDEADAPRAESEDETQFDTSDGASECAKFIERNDEELTDWEREQPPVPYRYPREKLFLDAPWSQLLHGLGRSAELGLATIIPHIGAQLRVDAPAVYLGWPWTVVALGPKYACTRKRGTFVVHGHKAHRVLAEPAVVLSTRGVGLSIRPGYRFVWHPTSWVVGPGIGLGSTVELLGNREPFRYSISPEVVAHFGRCCRSSYFTLAVRFDHFFKGTATDIIGGNLGYTFF